MGVGTTFKPAYGLASAHAQTVFAAVFRPPATLGLVRERWDTPDGDFLDVDVLGAPGPAPHILVLHGLEGSSQSRYVAGVLAHAASMGWGAVALNFRSCSGEPNRLARSYHAGETGDARFALERLRERTRGPLFAAGFSLGGNVLARLLAELGENSPLNAAAVVSVPFDLTACVERLDARGFWPRLYRRWFLRTLLAKARFKAERHPGKFDAQRLKSISSLRDYDDAVTAPVHGFANAAEYYGRSSSGPLLDKIRTPTLVLSAEDDPLAPPVLSEVARRNERLDIILTPRGGHVGFVAGSVLRPRFWAEQQVFAYFAARADAEAREVGRPPGRNTG